MPLLDWNRLKVIKFTAQSFRPSIVSHCAQTAKHLSVWQLQRIQVSCLAVRQTNKYRNNINKELSLKPLALAAKLFHSTAATQWKTITAPVRSGMPIKMKLKSSLVHQSTVPCSLAYSHKYWPSINIQYTAWHRVSTQQLPGTNGLQFTASCQACKHTFIHRERPN